MKKRSAVLKYTLALGVLVALVVILAPSGITLFYFPAYRGVGQGLTFLLLGGGMFYVGIKQIQAVKGRAEPLPWWKHYLIILALFWVCAGVLECLTWLFTVNKLFHDGLNSLVGTGIGILFILLTIGIGIYGISLAIVQATMSKRAGF